MSCHLLYIVVTAACALPVASEPFGFQNTTHTVAFVLGGTLPCLLVKRTFHHVSLLSCLPRLDYQIFSLINYCLEFLLSLVGSRSETCPHVKQPLTVSQRRTPCRERAPNSRNRSTFNESPVARTIYSLYRWPRVAQASVVTSARFPRIAPRFPFKRHHTAVIFNCKRSGEPSQDSNLCALNVSQAEGAN